jgi:hypothetical protein
MLYLLGDQGNCNIRTMIDPCRHTAAKRMDARGLMSKNARLGKAHHRKDAAWLMNEGNILRLAHN